MLNRFSEMIAQGIAPGNYKEDTFPCNGPIDGISRLYNNVWGALSDTHMCYKDGVRVITGSIIKTPEKFDMILSGDFIGACKIFVSTGKYHNFIELMQAHNLCGKYDKQNGDDVYVIMPCEEQPAGAQ